MASSIVVPNKQRLKKCTMKVKDIYAKADETANNFMWTIRNFRSLKKNVVYCNQGYELDWTFSILKKNRYYTVTISTGGYDEKLVCSVCYCEGQELFSCPITADIISESEQKVKIPDNVIDVSQNFYLQADCVKLLFVFNYNCDVMTPTLQPRYLIDDCTYECVDRLLLSTENTSLTDFAIEVHNNVVNAHKAVLASRSSYFRQYIEENCTDGQIGEMVVDTTYNSMYTVISFLYTGHVILKDGDNLTEILALSEKFGLTMLQTHMENCIASTLEEK